MKCRRGWSGWAMSPQHWFKASAAFSHSLLQSDITRIPPFHSNSKRGQKPYFYPIHSIQQKEVSCAKSPHPCSRLPTHIFFFSISFPFLDCCHFNQAFFFFFFLFVCFVHSRYGAVSSTCPAAALLFFPQAQRLALAFALPKPRSLEDLLYKLLKGTLYAVFGLCTCLWIQKKMVTMKRKQEHLQKPLVTLKKKKKRFLEYVGF